MLPINSDNIQIVYLPNSVESPDPRISNQIKFNLGSVDRIEGKIYSDLNLRVSHKEIKKTPISLEYQNKNLKSLSYLDLPRSFQFELSEEVSDELCILSSIALKIIEISFEISTNGSEEVNEVLKHLHLIPYKIFQTYCDFYINKDKQKRIKEYNALKTCFSKLLTDIEKVSPLTSEKNQMLFQRIYAIIQDLDAELIFDKKPLFLGIKPANLIENSFHLNQSRTPVEALSLLQKKIYNIFKFYSFIYEIFLKDNHVFLNNYSDLKLEWENIAAQFKSIKILFSKKRKAGITFNTCDQLMHNLWNRLKPFKNFALWSMNSMDAGLLRAIPSVPIINFEKYGFKNLYNREEKLDDNTFNNYMLFNETMRCIRLSTIDIRQETLKIGNAYCNQKKLILSSEGMNELFIHLKNFIKDINKINISFNSEAITPLGQKNGNFVFAQLESISNVIYENWNRYLNDQNTIHIGNLYMNLFWLRHNIGDALVSFLSESAKKMVLQKNTIDSLSKTKNKAKMLREKKILEQSLFNIASIKEILSTHYHPMEKVIDNFEQHFLCEKKLEVLEEEINEAVIDNIIEKEEPKNEPQIDKNSTVKIDKEKKIEPKLNKNQKKSQVEISNEPPQIIEDFNSKLNSLNESLKSGEENYQRVRNVKFMELIEEVIDHGFRFLKQTGSHVNFKNPEHPELGIITVPRHCTVSPGVVNQVRTKLRKK